MTHTWTTRELDIVETLTRRVRLLSLSQLGRVWWPEASSHRVVRLAMRRLLHAELILRSVINAHPLLVIKGPLLAWMPGQDAPDSTAIGNRIKSRWHGAAEPIEVYWPSPLAANLFGSTARDLPALLHRDHDLLLSEVYVLYRTQRPQLATRWLGECVFPQSGFRLKDPDAFLFGDDGRPARVIESAGRYGVAQVESFHEHCLEHDLPYELW